MKKFARIVALLLVIVASAMAIWNTPGEFRGTSGLAQRSVAVAVSLYGVLGAVISVGMLRRRRWAVRLSVAWGVCVTYAATAATLIFSEQVDGPVVVGALSAFVTCLLLAWWVVWAAKQWTKPRPPAVGL